MNVSAPLPARWRERAMPKVTFVAPDDSRRTLDVPAGFTILEIAREFDIDIEGTCDGCLACTTCHVIVDPASYPLLAAPSVDEDDMLDLAYGLAPTSRLGCQIVVTDALDGITLTIPGEDRGLQENRR